MKDIISLAGMSILVCGYVACSEFSAFHDEADAKNAFLQKSKLFDVTTQDADPFFNQTPPGENQPVPEVPRPPPPPPGPGVQGSVGTSNQCSDAWNGIVGSNLTVVPRVYMHLVNAAGQEACVYEDESVRSRAVSLRQISFGMLARTCPNIPSGKYYLTMNGSATTRSQNLLIGLNLGMPDGAETDAIIYISRAANNDIVIRQNPQQYALLIDQNRNRMAEQRPGGNEACDWQDQKASPLIVQISDGTSTRPIRLTPPTHGILFDILGDNATPPHAKQRISWFSDQVSAVYNYWIVLPVTGQIEIGIDQMFGDNTKGPDDKFAANGFEALKKWDVQHDGRIDRTDAVYSKLRLWFDKNRDGLAQDDELVELRRAGVESIDLDYDSKFAESDIFGNEIKFKSVMKMRDGRMNIVYDLWFRKI